MAITKLELATVHFEQKNYHDVLLKLFSFNDFHPELASKFSDHVAGLATFSKENVYEEISDRIDELINKYNLDIKDLDLDIERINVDKINKYLDKIEGQVNLIDSVKAQLDQMIEENNEAMIQLNHVAGMEINFDDLFSCKYLQVRFGKLPLENISKLKYYNNLTFSFQEFEKDENYLWCMYVTTPSFAPEIDNIFASLFFERVYIPPFVHGEPELAIESIQAESNGALEHSENLNTKIKNIFDEHIEELNKIYSICTKLKDVYHMQKYTVVMGDSLAIYGFIKKKDSAKFKESFDGIKGVHIDLAPANNDSRLVPPTLIKNNWFVEPFKLFVEMYGSPGYNEIDPTVFVAISYTFLFGMMFGDVGQGLLLSLIGFLAYKKRGMELGRVGIRLGFSSALFGLFFGSLFGNEEILHGSFHVMDSSNTMVLLLVAVAIGVSFILISMLFNMILKFKSKNTGEALFSQNGICGFVFYSATLGYVADMMLDFGFVSTMYIWVLMILPILGVFFKEPLTHVLEGKKAFPHGIGGFLTESVFELFEVLLSFIANTMSFLRVGGFVLSHAGMMLVVYTLAEMVGGLGYYFVLVFGNLFVMALEGLIVGIQVLRLEFYEMFSRYYQGSGIQFKSINDERN